MTTQAPNKGHQKKLAEQLAINGSLQTANLEHKEARKILVDQRDELRDKNLKLTNLVNGLQTRHEELLQTSIRLSKALEKLASI